MKYFNLKMIQNTKKSRSLLDFKLKILNPMMIMNNIAMGYCCSATKYIQAIMPIAIII